MTAFYDQMSALATEMMAEYGRSITLVKFSETPSDASKPWNGRTGVDTTLTLNAVFVPPNTVRQFGLTALGEGTEYIDMITRSEQIAICNPDTEDVREYTALQDGGIEYGIIATQVLKPGDKRLLAFIGVRR